VHRRAAAADILLTPPIVTDRRVVAAVRVSASRRRSFRGVLTSFRTPAIMWLFISVMPFTMKLEHLQKQ